MLSKSQLALDNLRVCWRNRPVKFNCGVCEKCIRTMVNLEISGVLDKCKTFNRKLTLSMVANTTADKLTHRINMQENYDALAQSGDNPQLLKALSKSLSPRAKWRPKRILRSMVPKRTIKSLIIWFCKRSFGRRIRDVYRKIFCR